MDNPAISILIVDDDAAHAKTISRALAEVGGLYRVETASSLGEFHDKIARFLPGLVIADLNLPDGKAFDLLAHAREANRYPVLVMTAFGDEEIAVRAMKTGALDYIVKSEHAFREMPHIVERSLREWRLMQDHKQAEEALRESQELFSLFMRHSPIYAFIKTVTPTESRVLQASDNFQQMVGIPARDMVGKTMSELFPAELAAKITADDWAVIANNKALRLEEELNGRIYTTIKFPLIIGNKAALAGYNIDITEHKRAEEALRENEEKFSKAFQTSPYAIVITRAADGKFIEVNDAFTSMTGSRGKKPSPTRRSD